MGNLDKHIRVWLLQISDSIITRRVLGQDDRPESSVGVFHVLHCCFCFITFIFSFFLDFCYLGFLRRQKSPTALWQPPHHRVTDSLNATARRRSRPRRVQISFDDFTQAARRKKIDVKNYLYGFSDIFVTFIITIIILLWKIYNKRFILHDKRPYVYVH